MQNDHIVNSMGTQNASTANQALCQLIKDLSTHSSPFGYGLSLQIFFTHTILKPFYFIFFTEQSFNSV